MLRLLLRKLRHAHSAGDVARSLKGIRVSAATVIAVARRLDTVLAVERAQGRARGALAISVRPRAEDEVRKTVRSVTADVRKARRRRASSV